MDELTLKQYESLSPFEIKDFLAKAALKTASASAATYINAGRGNPNWTATEPREAFFTLGHFAVSECKRVMDLPPGIGGMPKAQGIAARFEAWLAKNGALPGVRFLTAMLPWTTEHFRFDPDAFVHELVDSIIGDNYPSRIECWCITNRSCANIFSGRCAANPGRTSKFNIYAVEGGTAAMCYLFKSLKSNRLLNAGDTIALGVPIFTPYLEMPHLEDYALNIVEIRARQENRFQFTEDELDKLLDPKIKAFFVCNPGNPSAMALSDEVIAKIGQILDKRPDLILLTDDVYGTFVPGFRGLLGAFPKNTIGVYSYSKYFGCTGWRLGTIAVHEVNVFDELIAALPEAL